jgi:hypothetical protein
MKSSKWGRNEIKYDSEIKSVLTSGPSFPSFPPPPPPLPKERIDTGRIANNNHEIRQQRQTRERHASHDSQFVVGVPQELFHCQSYLGGEPIEDFHDIAKACLRACPVMAPCVNVPQPHQVPPPGVSEAQLGVLMANLDTAIAATHVSNMDRVYVDFRDAVVAIVTDHMIDEHRRRLGFAPRLDGGDGGAAGGGGATGGGGGGGGTFI